LHRIKLPLENASSDYADNYQSESEPPNAARPMRHHSFIDLVFGFTFLIASAVSVYFSQKGTEYADDFWPSKPIWLLPCLSFLMLALWLAGHAVGYLERI
jgi:hypothetical protein